jgi:hypothetical protein
MVGQSHLKDLVDAIVHIHLILVQVLTMKDPDRVLDPFHVDSPMVIDRHTGAMISTDIVLDHLHPDVVIIGATGHAHLLQDV